MIPHFTQHIIVNLKGLSCGEYALPDDYSPSLWSCSLKWPVLWRAHRLPESASDHLANLRSCSYKGSVLRRIHAGISWWLYIHQTYDRVLLKVGEYIPEAPNDHFGKADGYIPEYVTDQSPNLRLRSLEGWLVHTRVCQWSFTQYTIVFY